MKGRVQINHVGYLGGHPAHPAAKSNGVLVADNEGLHMRGIREMFVIPWGDVREIVVEGSEEAQRRVTATRLVTMGVFAFAAKKRSGTVYLGVGTAEFSAGFEIEGKGAGEVRSALARWVQVASPPPPVASQPSPGGLADALARLADLRDQGILTEEEFVAQKVRLLGL